MEGLLADLKAAPEGAVVMLHGVAHNPTGMDPSLDQWKLIADVLEERKLLPLVDFAYQGFASGDVETDAAAPRYLVSRGFDVFIAQSFSKNFGLYSERVGNLALIVSAQSVEREANVLSRSLSQLRRLVREMWSNPPSHGARIVSTVLNNGALVQEWRQCLSQMAARIQLMRQLLYERLRSLGTPGDWAHLVAQTGMFSYTALTPRQVEYLRRDYHIYGMPSGRINVCGLNRANVDYVANAIHDAVLHAEKPADA